RRSAEAGRDLGGSGALAAVHDHARDDDVVTGRKSGRGFAELGHVQVRAPVARARRSRADQARRRQRQRSGDEPSSDATTTCHLLSPLFLPPSWVESALASGRGHGRRARPAFPARRWVNFSPSHRRFTRSVTVAVWFLTPLPPTTKRIFVRLPMAPRLMRNLIRRSSRWPASSALTFRHLPPTARSRLPWYFAQIFSGPVAASPTLRARTRNATCLRFLGTVRFLGVAFARSSGSPS